MNKAWDTESKQKTERGSPTVLGGQRAPWEPPLSPPTVTLQLGPQFNI